MNEIIFANVSFGYDKDLVFSGLNFNYNFKDFLVILGPNGAGKSTFLKLILGAVKPQKGKIIFDEGTKAIGYVPQLIAINKSFPISVLEVVLMGRLDQKSFFGYSKNDKTYALNALEKVGMKDFANRKISELSGGQRQRVYIARALCADAKVLILDEPLANIDINGQLQIYELLKNLNSSGIGVIMVTHETNLALNYATKAIYVENGKVVMHEIHAKKTFLEHLAHVHSHFCEIELALGECPCQK